VNPSWDRTGPRRTRSRCAELIVLSIAAPSFAVPSFAATVDAVFDAAEPEPVFVPPPPHAPRTTADMTNTIPRDAHMRAIQGQIDARREEGLTTGPGPPTKSFAVGRSGTFRELPPARRVRNGTASQRAGSSVGR
jgi:hypothetical protein